MESVHNDRYKDRWVYNTNFHDTQLLDVKNVQKLISMYRFTKPNVLFSDVVKKTSQSHTRTCDHMARKPKGKISQGTSVKWYGNQTLKTGLKSGSSGVYTETRPCLPENQSRVNNSRSKQYWDSIDSICSQFEALPVENCIVDKCDSSAVVDVKGDRQRHTSKTVNVKKKKRTVNKGKNVSFFIYSLEGPCRNCFMNTNRITQILTI